MQSTTRRHRALLAIVLCTGLLAAACGDDDDSNGDAGTGSEGGELSGTIRADGSSTVGPLTEVAAEMYMSESDVNVTVAISGTSGGFEKFCIGETDMNNSSREIKETEVDLCGDNEIGYDNIQVANDALALVVNNDNPIDCLSVDQASQIWDEGSDVSTWGDVDGLDVSEEFAGQALTLYGPGTDSGTFDFFTEVINGEEGRIRTDYTDIGEDDDAAVRGVEGDVGAMGYIPYSYFQEYADSVKPLEIDGGDGCVEATLENVQNDTYVPLGRPLFTYASDTALARPEVLDFMTFYIDNAQEIAELAGFVPMTDDQVAAQHDRIGELAGGGS